MKKNKFIDILKWAWMVVVLAAGVYYVVRNYQSALDYLGTIKTSGLVLSTLFIIISRLLNVDLIRESVKEVGWKPKKLEMFALISITQLGKYVPGGVWQFAARFGAYKSNQLTVKKMGKAFFLENVWVVLGGAMGGLFFLLLGDPRPLLDRFGISLPAPLMLTLAGLSIVIWLVGLFIFQRISHKQDSPGRSLVRSLRLFASHFLMYFTMGVSFFFLFSFLNEDDLLFTVGGYIISYLAGYIVIFAPGGIGVREVVSLAIFSGLAAQAELGTITIVHRLLYTLIEFAMGFMGFLMTRVQKKDHKGEEMPPELVPTQPDDASGTGEQTPL